MNWVMVFLRMIDHRDKSAGMQLNLGKTGGRDATASRSCTSLLLSPPLFVYPQFITEDYGKHGRYGFVIYNLKIFNKVGLKIV